MLANILTNPTTVVLAGIAIVGLLFWYVATEVDRRKRNVGTVVVGLVVALCVIAILPIEKKLKGGIDLIGGSSFTVKVNPGETDTGEVLEVDDKAVGLVKEILGKRLATSGLSDNIIQPLGKDRLIIEMPGIEVSASQRVRNIIQKTVILEIKEVHPQTNSLASRIKSGAEIAPAGYKLYDLRIMDDKTGTQIGSEPILLSRRNILTGEHVQYARKDFGRFGVAGIRLSSEGGERFYNATSKMTPNQDRMAVVLDGKRSLLPRFKVH